MSILSNFHADIVVEGNGKLEPAMADDTFDVRLMFVWHNQMVDAMR